MIHTRKISVRKLVEYVYRSGSIDLSFQGRNRLVEGTMTHQRIQEAQDEEHYQKEVPLSYTYEKDGFRLIVEGRADGILTVEDEVTIEEIKSTKRLSSVDVEKNQTHWAQAKLYGFIYAKENGLTELTIQLTYADVHSDDAKSVRKPFSFTELEDFAMTTIEEYMKFVKVQTEFQERRNESIKELNFPFPQYREGQRNLAVAVYKTISEEKRLFAKAPTGIGKTISTLFPSLKAMGEQKVEKLIYLTAKTITRTVAEDTVAVLRENGLRVKACTITAKDKVCLKEETLCQAEYCEFANGYYDRLNEGLIDFYQHEDVFDRQTIDRYAKKYTLCPFEFSLDVALLADIIICDYNYLFDPRVSLKRLADMNKRSFAVLIDEAHNLMDRARAMYSCELSKASFLEVKRLFNQEKNEIYHCASELNAYFLERKKEVKDSSFIEQALPEKLLKLIEEFIDVIDKWLPTNRQSEGYQQVLDLYFAMNTFSQLSKVFNERFIGYVEKNRNDVVYKILCLDPSQLLKDTTKRNKATIFFSATLTPHSYYRDILGGEEDDYAYSLPSPFDQGNLKVKIANLSTRYKDRERTLPLIVESIYEEMMQQPGNFLVFCPSYHYMNMIVEQFKETYQEVEILEQAQTMNEEEREGFLAQFNETREERIVGFAVLGGIFSEGIDLKRNRLNGVIIVGVGLPQFNVEQDILKDYYQSIGKNGYDFAYVIPGMNKVLQAGGRLIRTEQDTGTLVLIDDRFLSAKYQRLLPKEWSHYEVIKKSSYRV
ncbi:ATP-dependent DNA helicase [Bacillus timonensis]|nr:ATP-dependent DNA helicase [Bacillus timonensis]